MDTVTCETCSCEIRGDNVDAHFEWHQAQAEALEAAVDRAVTRMKTDAIES